MVLVVDDHAETRAVMVRLLKLEGYEADSAASGPDALDYIAKQRPHCLILDISMPGMDGFAVLQTIRDNERLKEVRVIMYSAFDGELKDRAFRMGADAFVQKGSLD